LRFFYDVHSKQNRTNPLWSWSIGKEKAFPVAEFESKNFEVIGNLYEGKKKKTDNNGYERMGLVQMQLYQLLQTPPQFINLKIGVAHGRKDEKAFYSPRHHSRVVVIH